MILNNLKFYEILGEFIFEDGHAEKGLLHSFFKAPKGHYYLIKLDDIEKSRKYIEQKNLHELKKISTAVKLPDIRIINLLQEAKQ